MTPAARSIHGRRPGRVAGLAGVVAIAVVLGGADRPHGQQPAAGGVGLRPTAHDPIPADVTGYWLSPAAGTAVTPALRDFARAVGVIDGSGDARSVAPLLQSAALDKTPLADHVRYYRGLAALGQDDLETAEAAFGAVAAGAPSAIGNDAHVRLAETHERQGRYGAAAAAYTQALAARPTDPAALAHKLGVALERGGDVAASIAAHRRVYFDYPLSADADASGDVLARLGALDGDFEGRLARERARADALYAARRWALARTAYGRVYDLTSGDARAAAALRAAAADVQLKQYRTAVERLRPLAAEGPDQAEARLHLALAARGQGQMDAFERGVRDLAAAFPSSPYAEEGLNALATSFIRGDDDAGAAAVFGEMVAAFPGGRFAERAAWKAGWWAYRQGALAEAVRFFETGAAHFPRSDYRPSWLYWSARAKERLDDTAGATARYTLAATDYQNSYYGRLALRRLGRPSVTPSITESPALRAPTPPTQPQIALLLALGLHDLAIAELQYARRVWGDAPGLVATTAVAQHRAGRLRLGINAMKRAYPQYLAAGGESLPADVMRVLYPLDYWPLLEAGAAKHGLDQYLVAALAAQESTFDAAIRSSAGAIGLMQIMPSTGRGFARRMGIRPFSTGRLTDPAVNAAIGTQYLADLMKQFGGAPYALAAYNAGEHRVVRWKGERPGLPEDEWVDDIPFPETQNYVKRILGTAEDYRRLYGGGVLTPLNTPGATVKPLVIPPASPAPARRPAPKRRRPSV
ncbi:MAG: transglycosylase SLT domain-containing protein [Vicinamibacterales bacterium]